MPRKLTIQEAMALTKMKVIKRADRPNCLMIYIDPKTGAEIRRTTKQRLRKDAMKVAQQRAVDVASGSYRDRLDWEEFCATYKAQALASQAACSRTSWRTVRKHLGKFRRVQHLDDLTTIYITEWQTWLRNRGLTDSSVAAYSARLKAALNWAVTQDLLAAAPRVAVGEFDVRGRALSDTEMKAYLTAIPEVRPKDAEACKRFILGLALSGLRLNELLNLSWESSSSRWLDAGGTYPVVRFTVRGQKKRRTSERAISRDFWDLCCEANPDREGTVLLWPNGKGGQMSQRRASGILSAIGRHTGIVTDPDTNKCITAHDLRRTFARQMHQQLPLSDVRDMLGHSHSKTTDRYLQGTRSEEIAEKLWGQKPRIIKRGQGRC